MDSARLARAIAISYRYKPPHPLEEIEADIRGIETDIVWMLREVAG